MAKKKVIDEQDYSIVPEAPLEVPLLKQLIELPEIKLDLEPIELILKSILNELIDIKSILNQICGFLKPRENVIKP